MTCSTNFRDIFCQIWKKILTPKQNWNLTKFQLEIKRKFMTNQNLTNPKKQHMCCAAHSMYCTRKYLCSAILYFDKILLCAWMMFNINLSNYSMFKIISFQRNNYVIMSSHKNGFSSKCEIVEDRCLVGDFGKIIFFFGFFSKTEKYLMNFFSGILFFFSTF